MKRLVDTQNMCNKKRRGGPLKATSTYNFETDEDLIQSQEKKPGSLSSQRITVI